MTRPTASPSYARASRLVLATALVAGLLAAAAPRANAFATVEGLFGQNLEHENITRAALGCPTGGWTRTAPCFEARSLGQLAGRGGLTFGAVGLPDRDVVAKYLIFLGTDRLVDIPQTPGAHCDDADFASLPDSNSYPVGSGTGLAEARRKATEKLAECVAYLRGQFAAGATSAAGMLTGGNLDPSELALETGCFLPEGGLPLGRAKCEALEGFGRALHGSQDFYSHSNWTDARVERSKLSLANPQGLAETEPSELINLAGSGLPNDNSPPDANTVPAALTTGCFELLELLPGILGDTPFLCRGRVRHDDVSKDKGQIEPATGAVTVTSTSPPPGRGRAPSNTGDNFRMAVEVAIADTKKQWERLQTRLRATPNGDLLICALTRDDPVSDCGPSIETASLLPSGRIGSAYDVKLSAGGPRPAASFTVIKGTLPSGLSLDGPTGTLSGRPTATGTSTFTVQLKDTAGATAEKEFEVRVDVPLPQEVAFSSDRTGRFQIWRTGIEPGDAARQVTTAGAGAQESRGADWSGQSQFGNAGQISYQFGATLVRGIHMLPADGAGTGDVRLTLSGGDERDPSWSPDGRRIVYSSQPTGATNYDLWIHEVGDPGTTADDDDYLLLGTAGQELRPSWSPDGAHIAYTAQGGTVGVDAEVAVVDVGRVGSRIAVSGGPRLVTQNASTEFDPTWSPDGTKLAYSSTAAGNRDVFRVPLCPGPASCEFGPDFKALTTAAADDTNPDWSPDGRSVAFVSQRDGNREVYRVDATAGEAGGGTPAARLTTDPGSDDDPAWGPPPPTLGFSKTPSGPATAKRAFSTQPEVTIRDAGGAVLTGDNTTVVTLSTGSVGTSSLTCTGGLSATAVNGVASFGGCSVDKPGKVVIRASAPVLTPADAPELEVLAGAITFEQPPPESVTVGVPFPQPLRVAVRDATGTVTTDDDTTVIDLAVGLGDPAAFGCATPLAQRVVSGVATFSGCEVRAAGLVSLVATSAGLTPGVTKPITAFTLGYLNTPFLTSLIPDTAAAGAGPLTITAEGTNFNSGSTVRWNGAARATTFVNAGKLTAQITVADLAVGGALTTANVTVQNPGGATSAALPFTIRGPGVARAGTASVAPGTAVEASTAPAAAGDAGVSATLTNLADPGADPASLTVATYAGRPVGTSALEAPGGFTDVRVLRAGATSLAQAAFYYPSTVTGATEADLQLFFWDGTAWSPVKSSGPSSPTKDTTDNLDGTVSGGRISAVFDATSTPTVSQLGGTVFAAAVAAGGTPPALSIADVKLKEGDSGQADAAFQVSLSAAAGQAVKVDFATTDGTATAAGDYAAKSGTVEFAPGETTKAITVAVKGDTLDEPDETFTVKLANPTNATIEPGKGTGTATIEDDDTTAGNRPPDCRDVVANPHTLWPADHRLRLVVLTGATDPDGDPLRLVVTGVTQDEALNGADDGNTTPDAMRSAGPGEVFLRAERSGRGDGRVYRVSFEATDPGGLGCHRTVTVSVPLVQGRPAVDSGHPVNSFGDARSLTSLARPAPLPFLVGEAVDK